MSDSGRYQTVLLNRGANERVQIFLLFALGYIIIVEVVSAGSALLERRFRMAR